METQCLKIKLKDGKEQQVREWCKTFVNHPDLDEVLKKETVVVESLFLDEQEDGTYLLFYLKAKSLHQANEFLTTVQHPLNDLSREFMQECWEMDQVEELELVLDLDTIT